MASEKNRLARHAQRYYFRAPGSGDSGPITSYEAGPLDKCSGVKGASLPTSIESALIAAQDLNLASALFLHEAQKLGPCYSAAFYSIDEPKDEATAILFARESDVSTGLGCPFPLANSWLAQHLHSVHLSSGPTSETEEAPPLGPEALPEGIKSSLWVPLGHQGHRWGIMALHSNEGDAFDSGSIEKASALGRRLAPSVDSAARHLGLIRQQKFAEGLHRSSQALVSDLDTPQLLDVICRECCNSLEASYAVLSEVHGEKVILRGSWPADPPHASGPGFHRAPNGQGLDAPLEPVLAGQTVVVNGVLGDPGPRHQVGALVPNANLWAPLTVRDRVIGVLELAHVGTGRKFTSCCLQMVEAFAAHAAVALENSRLNKETLKVQERSTRVVAQLEAVLKAAEAGVLLVNDQQQVLWMNEKFGEFFGVDDAGPVVDDEQPAQLGGLREIGAGCFIDAEGFFAERDRIDADSAFAGYVGDVQLVHPQPRVLQEFTTPVYGDEQTYIGRLWVYHDVTVQRQNEEHLRQSEFRQKALLDAIPDAIFRISKDGTYLDYVAPDDFRLVVPSEAFLGKSIESVMPPEISQPAMDCIARALSSHQVQTLEYQLTIDNRARDYEARIVANGPEEVLGIVREVTERKSLEAQFLQAQKLESLGRLAGGIAHDFNNLLGGIMGYASLLRSKLEPDSEGHKFASIIEKATERGAQLTQQLLTAARRSRFESQPIDINEVIEEVVQIVTHTLPRGVKVAANLDPDLPLVPGDQSQIHQVLMNLCINAADAMPNGGPLTISNQEVFLDEKFCRQHLSIEPGQYVRLTVSDAGTGISDADLPRIFDPFFTTKDPGKGTGLGLAVVYAIVKNHSGIIDVHSVLGEGTSFVIYLPISNAQPI